MTHSRTAVFAEPATHDSQVARRGLAPRPSGGNLARRPRGVGPRRRVLRFSRSERQIHWAIAVPFMICFVTALVLVLVYNPAPHRAWRGVFSWAHRISGLCLLLAPMLVALRSRSDWHIHLRNIGHAWVWSLSDLKWIALMGAAALSRRVSLPESGKFNAAEKLNFMMVMMSWPLFIVTGLLIWLPGPDFLAWTVHLVLAVIIAPLMLGHIYMATLNPSTRVGVRGMISGFVDRGWARHHYARWYRETFEASAAPATPNLRVAPGPRITACCAACGPSDSKVSWTEFVQSRLHGERLRCPTCKGEKLIVLVVGEPNSERLLQHFMDCRRDAGPFVGGLPRDRVLMVLVEDRAQRVQDAPRPAAPARLGPNAAPNAVASAPPKVEVTT